MRIPVFFWYYLNRLTQPKEKCGKHAPLFANERRIGMTSLVHIMQDLAQSSSLPLYQQLQRALREAIDKRVFGPDEALPAERQLATDLAVSRITVRKAIDGLVSEGLLVKRPGSGNFINTKVEKNFAKLTSFSEDMLARGRTPRSVWLARSEGTVTPEEAMRLGLSPGAPVFRFHRIRYADEIPMCLEYATIVKSSLPALETVGVSMYQALEEAGNRPVRALQRLSAILLNAEQAKLLQAKEGDAGLSVERLGFLRDGTAVEFCRSYFRGDMYDFVAELST
jgi:GntR family transcriptional regulator